MPQSPQTFEKYLSENGVPANDVMAPLDRVLIRSGIRHYPIGLLNFTRRALWLSFSFTLLFTAFVELTFLVFVKTSALGAIPWQTHLQCLLVLLAFGPIGAFFNLRSMRRHEVVLANYLQRHRK